MSGFHLVSVQTNLKWVFRGCLCLVVFKGKKNGVPGSSEQKRPMNEVCGGLLSGSPPSEGSRPCSTPSAAPCSGLGRKFPGKRPGSERGHQGQAGASFGRHPLKPWETRPCFWGSPFLGGIQYEKPALFVGVPKQPHPCVLSTEALFLRAACVIAKGGKNHEVLFSRISFSFEVCATCYKALATAPAPLGLLGDSPKQRNGSGIPVAIRDYPKLALGGAWYLFRVCWN